MNPVNQKSIFHVVLRRLKQLKSCEKRPFQLSLFFHFCLMALLFFMPEKESQLYSMNTKNAKPKSSIVEISIENKKVKQIIQQDVAPLNHKVPKETRFLGRYNQSVKKESVKYAKGIPAISKKNSRRKQKIQLFNKAYNQWKQKRAPAFVKEPEKNIQRQKNFQREKNLHSIKTLSQFDSGTQDHIKGVKKGAETLLNSRQFVYYSYYNRIRQQVNQYWRPRIRQKIQNLALANRYMDVDRVTRLKITLDSKGHLLNIKVLRRSGSIEIDSVALQAFKQAGHFPNPPKSLIKKDGTISIHWSFILET